MLFLIWNAAVWLLVLEMISGAPETCSIPYNPPSVYATGDYPLYVIVEDFNYDKKLDMAVSNARDGSISVYLGHGDGSFEQQQAYVTGGGATFMVTGDFNRDKKLDIASTNDRGVCILFGNGN